MFCVELPLIKGVLSTRLGSKRSLLGVFFKIMIMKNIHDEKESNDNENITEVEENNDNVEEGRDNENITEV